MLIKNIKLISIFTLFIILFINLECYALSSGELNFLLKNSAEFKKAFKDFYGIWYKVEQNKNLDINLFNKESDYQKKWTEKYIDIKAKNYMNSGFDIYSAYTKVMRERVLELQKVLDKLESRHIRDYDKELIPIMRILKDSLGIHKTRKIIYEEIRKDIEQIENYQRIYRGSDRYLNLTQDQIDSINKKIKDFIEHLKSKYKITIGKTTYLLWDNIPDELKDKPTKKITKRSDQNNSINSDSNIPTFLKYYLILHNPISTLLLGLPNAKSYPYITVDNKNYCSVTTLYSSFVINDDFNENDFHDNIFLKLITFNNTQSLYNLNEAYFSGRNSLLYTVLLYEYDNWSNINYSNFIYWAAHSDCPSVLLYGASWFSHLPAKLCKSISLIFDFETDKTKSLYGYIKGFVRIPLMIEVMLNYLSLMIDCILMLVNTTIGSIIALILHPINSICSFLGLFYFFVISVATSIIDFVYILFHFIYVFCLRSILGPISYIIDLII